MQQWSDAPIFIIGNPRSGTTLLQLMLTCSPSLSVPSECGFLIYLYPKFKDFNGKKEEIIHYTNEVINSKKMELWNIPLEGLLEYTIQRRPLNYAQLSSCVYEYYTTLNYPFKKRWGDKNNYYLNHINEIYEIFPKALFIHIVRDGRDVACSYKDMEKIKNKKYAPNLPGEIDQIAENWFENIKIIRDSFECIGWDKVIEIRYEDIVDSPVKTLTKLCDFLDLEYTDDMLNFNTENIEKQLVPREYDSWKSMNRKPLSNTKVGRWKSDLSKKELKAFEAIASDWLIKYSYK